NALAGGFLDRRENVFLADAFEEVLRGRREPRVHVETQSGGEFIAEVALSAVKKPSSARRVWSACRVRDWRGTRVVARFRFQPLPIRTAREVFPQAAHPVGFVERVMCRVGERRLSLQVLHPRQWLERPAPVQPEYTVEVFATPSPPTNTR